MDGDHSRFREEQVAPLVKAIGSLKEAAVEIAIN